MPTDSTHRTAIREGIGGRLIELGFRRKSERLYEKDEGELQLWTQFKLHDEGFVDWTGVRSKELEKLFADSGLALHQYNTSDGPDGHVFISGLEQWCNQSRANFDQAERGHSRRNPLNWFDDWRRAWADSDPYTKSPFQQSCIWIPDADPEGCAAQSLAKWREHVEPWLKSMRDPVAFAGWYCNGHITGMPDVDCSFAWARAGDKDRARTYLARASNLGPRTKEEAYRSLKSRYGLLDRRPARQDLERRAERLVKSFEGIRLQARRAADFIGVRLEKSPEKD